MRTYHELDARVTGSSTSWDAMKNWLEAGESAFYDYSLLLERVADCY